MPGSHVRPTTILAQPLSPARDRPLHPRAPFGNHRRRSDCGDRSGTRTDTSPQLGVGRRDRVRHAWWRNSHKLHGAFSTTRMAAAIAIFALGTIVVTTWWGLSRPARSRNTPDLLRVDRTTRSVLSSLVAHINEGDIVQEVWTIRGWLRGARTTPLHQLQIVHESNGQVFRTAVLTDYPVHDRAKRLAEAIDVTHRDYKLGRQRSPIYQEWDRFLIAATAPARSAD